jgi:hypothetical protein
MPADEAATASEEQMNWHTEKIRTVNERGWRW